MALKHRHGLWAFAALASSGALALDVSQLEVPPAAVASAPASSALAFRSLGRVVFPKVLLDAGNTGRVETLLDVDENGRLTEIKVTMSSHPAFESAVVDAMLDSTFKPFMQDGHPLRVRAPHVVLFNLDERNSKPQSAWQRALPITFPAKGDPGLPPEFHYDKPPIIRVMAPLVYPFELMRDQVTGSAEVQFFIDPKGRVRSVKLISASHPEFGEALKAMLSTSTFIPAKQDGQACWGGFRYKQTFNLQERDLVPSDSASRLLAVLRQQSVQAIYAMAQLDAPPKARYQPKPVFPVELDEAHLSGQALIEFYIDKDGRVQLPRVLKADQEALGWVAATTVKRWLFDAPRVNGSAVTARVTVPVSFKSSAVLP